MSSLEKFISVDKEDSPHVLSEIQLIRRINRFEERVKSQKFLQKSNFLELSEEVALINEGILISFDEEEIEAMPRPQWLYSDESVFISVIWDSRNIGDQTYSAKALAVEALPNGIIIVRGNAIGSTVLSQTEWENKTIKQMDALTKASKNPMPVQYEKAAIINYSIDQRLLF